MKYELDDLDRKIVYYLELNSSSPVSVISKKVRRSKEVVSYRIRRMQQRKILLRCSAIVDMAKLGYFTFRVYIKWQNITSSEKKQFWEELGYDEHIWTIANLHGKWDLAFFIGMKDRQYITLFHEIWDTVMAKYKDKIAATRIAIYAPVYNFNKRFMFPEKKDIVTRIYGEGILVDHDETDEKIIHAYGPDVRQPLWKVAKEIGVSIETVRQRIKRLEKNRIIAGYKIDLDLSLLGQQGYRVDFMLRSTSRNKELFEYIKQHPYFYQINKSIGGADFECEIVVSSLKELLAILEDTRDRFSDVISSYDYMGFSGFPRLTIVPD